MELEDFERILHDEEDAIKTDLLSEPGCNAIKGLIIIKKYLPLRGVEGADHDIIYSVDIVQIVDAGITEEDATVLRRLNWMISGDSLACFV